MDIFDCQRPSLKPDLLWRELRLHSGITEDMLGEPRISSLCNQKNWNKFRGIASHADAHRHTLTHTQRHIHTQIYTHTHSHSHTFTDTHRETHIHTDTLTHTETHIHTHLHAHWIYVTCCCVWKDTWKPLGLSAVWLSSGWNTPQAYFSGWLDCEKWTGTNQKSYKPQKVQTVRLSFIGFPPGQPAPWGQIFNPRPTHSLCFKSQSNFS